MIFQTIELLYLSSEVPQDGAEVGRHSFGQAELQESFRGALAEKGDDSTSWVTAGARGGFYNNRLPLIG